MARVNKLRKFRRLQEIRRHRRRIFMIFILWQMQLVNRSIWVHPLNNLREEKGEFYSLYPDLRHYNKKFFKFYRLSVEKFDQLLDLVGPEITKKYSNFRAPISPEQRLVLTLRYGLSVMFQYKTEL